MLCFVYYLYFGSIIVINASVDIVIVLIGLLSSWSLRMDENMDECDEANKLPSNRN